MLSAISYQSSVISHQSSVISHQSSVISHQSSVISHQSSVISHQSSVISYQPNPTAVILSEVKRQPNAVEGPLASRNNCFLLFAFRQKKHALSSYAK